MSKSKMSKFPPMMYYHGYQIPVWVLIESVDGADQVLKWFEDNEAFNLEWPAKTFMDTYMAFGQKGWSHKVNAPGKRNADLLHQAFVEHTKSHLNPHSEVALDHYNLVRMDRDLATAEDFAKFYNLCFDMINPLDLSKAFMVQEICYGSQGGHKVWVSYGDFDFNTISRLSRKVLTVGETSDTFTPDVVISSLGKKKKMESSLENKMIEVLSQVNIQKIIF